MRNADSRSLTGDHPRTRQERTATGETVSPPVQPGTVSACLREDLPQRRCHDPRRQRGDRGRHEPEEDSGDHRGAAVRALPVDPGAAHLHRQEELVEEASAGAADVVGQAAARSNPLPPGGVLRAAVLRPLPRVSAQDAGVTPPCGRSSVSGAERCGSSRATSPTVSGLWIIR